MLPVILSGFNICRIPASAAEPVSMG